MDDLQITQEDNQLVIRGRQTDDAQGRVFLHRGIAARQFQRASCMAEGIEVKGAWLDNGLLHIDLARPQPETKVRKIDIGKAAGQTSMVVDGNVSGHGRRRVPGRSRAGRSGLAARRPAWPAGGNVAQTKPGEFHGVAVSERPRSEWNDGPR